MEFFQRDAHESTCFHFREREKRGFYFIFYVNSRRENQNYTDNYTFEWFSTNPYSSKIHEHVIHERICVEHGACKRFLKGMDYYLKISCANNEKSEPRFSSSRPTPFRPKILSIHAPGSLSQSSQGNSRCNFSLNDSIGEEIDRVFPSPSRKKPPPRSSFDSTLALNGQDLTRAVPRMSDPMPDSLHFRFETRFESTYSDQVPPRIEYITFRVYDWNL